MKVDCDSKGVELAVKTVKNGGVLVFPTDTVYGIGCDPYNSKAVMRVYKIKNREPGKLFPILAYSKKDLEKIVFFDEKSLKIAEKFWPGPLTLILKLNDDKIKESMNLTNKIAVRIPSNDCILSVLEKCKLIIGTSANVSGSSPFVDPKESPKNLKNYDLFLDGGKISSNGESSIVEIDNEKIKILRDGAISKEEILKIV